MQLRSNIRGKTKIGYLVRADRSGRFVYARAGEVPIGVITESVLRGELCEIQTTGEALVYVYGSIGADETIRAPEAGETAPAGAALPIGGKVIYTAVGQALETGKGLVRVSVNLSATISIGTSAGVPAGGTTGQVLTKNSGTDYDTIWTTPAPGYTAWYYEYDTVTPQSVAITNGLSFGLVPGTDIGFSWDGVNRRQTINYTGTPGTMDDWYMQVNGGANHTIANHTQVNFQGGTYITATYTFSAPTHGVAYDINLTTMDARYTTLTYLAANYETYTNTQAWVNANFDKYTSWYYEYDTVTPQSVAITAGLSFGLVPGTDIGFSWDGANRRQTINYTGTPGTMDDWYMQVNGGANHTIANHTQVNFQGGTYITATYTFSAPTHGVAYDINLTTMDARYTTLTYLAANYETYTNTQAWVNANFDDYGSWDLETGGVHREYITAGFALDFVGDGTYIQVIYNATLDRLEFSYVGPVSSYTGWNLKVDASAVNLIQNAEELVFISGTNINLGYVVGAGTNSITVNLNSTISLTSVTTTTSVITNTISERTAASGVNIDGVLLKDSLVSVTSTLYSSTTSLYMGTTGAGNVYIRPSGYGSTTAQTTFGTTGITATVPVTVNQGSGYTTQLSDVTLTFTRNSASYIRASTAGGTISLITNGLSTGTANALVHIGTADVALRYGSATPATKLITTNVGVSVTGGVYATGEVESYDTSDIRLKKILGNLNVDETILGIMSLRTVRYEHTRKSGTRLGLIAQDVMYPFPENVKQDDDGFMMVHYGKMVVPLVLVSQNHEHRIRRLEQELSELKKLTDGTRTR